MIELYTTPTANGLKASIMLEETGFEYRVHKIALTEGAHLAPGYLAINPIGRIPTIVDHDTPGGKPLAVYGTAAILLYLGEKSGKLMPADLEARARVFQWLGIIQADIGAAYTGQFVFSVLAPQPMPWAVEHYNALCLRLVAAFEQQLGRTRFIAGDEYTIADVLGYPFATVSMARHPGSLDAYPNMQRWVAEVGARPAVRKGMTVGT